MCISVGALNESSIAVNDKVFFFRDSWISNNCFVSFMLVDLINFWFDNWRKLLDECVVKFNDELC